MNIAIVSQSYYPRPGGVTEHVAHTAACLRRRGHQVTVVTTHFGGDGVENDVIRLGRNTLLPVNGAWVNVTVGNNLYRRYKDVLHQLRPDVVHTHCPLAPTLPVYALKATPPSSGLVGTFHAAARSLSAYRIFKPILDRFIGRLDSRIAVSEAARSLAARYFPGSYTIIPNGVDCERFSPDVRALPEFCDDAFNILFVGRMDKRKGLKYLFRAVCDLSGAAPRRLRVIVVGDDGPRRHMLPRLPTGVDLVFTGVVPKEVLPRYFASGHVFCSPATDRESFGIVLLEAMASGVPVIGTAIPGYLTLLRDGWNARVVPPRDSRALATVLFEVMSDEPLRWKLRHNALGFARRYSWESVAARLESVYSGEPVTQWQAAEVSEPTGSLTVQKA